MREIPQCWITGQAAGVAAALAVQHGIQPRHVNVAELQQALLAQGVYLRPHNASEPPAEAETTSAQQLQA
jgi:hypothetical protein